MNILAVFGTAVAVLMALSGFAAVGAILLGLSVAVAIAHVGPVPQA